MLIIGTSQNSEQYIPLKYISLPILKILIEYRNTMFNVTRYYLCLESIDNLGC